jgi:hypothetical protein
VVGRGDDVARRVRRMVDAQAGLATVRVGER